MSTKPIFLVAARRSGTTLLRLMLGSHPDLHWERGWEFASSLIGDHGEPPTFDQLHNLLVQLDLESFPIDDNDDLMTTYRNILNQYIELLCDKSSKKIFGATIHVNFDKIQFVFPESKFVHLIRDPRDIAISAVKLGWDSTFWSAAKHWVRAEEEWEQLKEQIKPGLQFNLRYEDLIQNPENELRKLCEFIDIPYTEELFDYTKTSSYGYPDSSLIERWRGKLSPRETELIEARSGKLLQQRGYTPITNQRQPRKLSLLCLCTKNWVLHKVQRVKNEGITIVMLNILVHRLHISPLRNSLEKRRDIVRKENIRKLESDYSKKSK